MPMPKDAREQVILDRLQAVRDKLLLLKRDRTKYIRSQDVMMLYNQVIEQVRQLNEIRVSEHLGENQCAGPHTTSIRPNILIIRSG